MNKFELRQTKYFNCLKLLKQNINYFLWFIKGKPVPPIDYAKQLIIREYIKQNNISVFVETGTYFGDTTYFISKYVNRLFTIEIKKEFWENAVKRFQNIKKIEVLLGDSGIEIKRILEKLNERALFWLDGHYNNIKESEIKQITPIYKELDAIYEHKIKNHILLIDDARLFIGTNGYPILEDLIKYIMSKNPIARVDVKNDIIIVES
jgi:hypothetical protein